jgi:hypothetical protein
MRAYLHDFIIRFARLLPLMIPAALLAVIGVVEYARRRH